MRGDRPVTDRLTMTGKYTKQHWRCDACGARGFALLEVGDTFKQKASRVWQSHAAKSNLKKCPDPKLAWLDAEPMRGPKR
jgi:hypothetical protein